VAGGCRGCPPATEEGRRGHPVVISRKYREALLALSGDVGARQVVAANEQDTVLHVVGDPAVITDLDSVEGYQALVARKSPR
jgi:molybdenum cofactor cytidylyltransferase